MLSWVKFSADDTKQLFSDLPQKAGFGISCKLSPLKTICRKCQIQFSGKIKKTVVKLSSVEYAQRVVNFNKATDVDYVTRIRTVSIKRSKEVTELCSCEKLIMVDIGPFKQYRKWRFSYNLKKQNRQKLHLNAFSTKIVSVLC